MDVVFAAHDLYEILQRNLFSYYETYPSWGLFGLGIFVGYFVVSCHGRFHSTFGCHPLYHCKVVNLVLEYHQIDQNHIA